MPEAPDLEVVREFLADRIIGVEVVSVSVIKPSVLRSLAGGVSADAPGRAFFEVRRRGKLLLLGLSGDRMLVINPMLSGVLQYCSPKERMSKRTCISIALENGMELRYRDDRQMGAVYYVTGGQLGDVPRLGEQGPDVLDEFSLEEFQQRLGRFHGEIKGILTRGRVIAGVGNAYADEVLFAAKIYPFRRRKALSADEVRVLYEKSREVVEKAIPVLRQRMGEDIHVKVRDFLKVHNKGGEPCPDCGKPISQVTANRRITSYCRGCQPGMLIRN